MRTQPNGVSSPEEIAIDSAQTVYDDLGSGFTEHIYHQAMEVELSSRNIIYSSEPNISYYYKGVPLTRKQPDIIIGRGDIFIIEIKAKKSLTDSHIEQLSTYLKIAERDKNFNSVIGGIVVNFAQGSVDSKYDPIEVEDKGAEISILLDSESAEENDNILSNEWLDGLKYSTSYTEAMN